MKSRNKREGRYGGKIKGQHIRGWLGRAMLRQRQFRLNFTRDLRRYPLRLHDDMPDYFMPLHGAVFIVDELKNADFSKLETRVLAQIGAGAVNIFDPHGVLRSDA